VSEFLKQFLLQFLMEAIHAEMLKLGSPDVNTHISSLPVEHRAELSSELSQLVKPS